VDALLGYHLSVNALSSNDGPADLALLDINAGVATVTLNRPEAHNGWTGGLEQAYYDRLQQCNDDPDVKVIVVTGAGRSFCPGADMNMMSGAVGGKAPAPGEKIESTQPVDFPLTINKPMIAAINGACAGVGMVQALMCDLRFAVPTAKFTMAFARRGLIAEYGSAWLLPRIVGQANALDLLMSSRVVLADEAHGMGLINRVIAPDQLLPHTQAYARDIAANCSPTSMAVMKQQVDRAWGMDFATAIAEAHHLMGVTTRRPDFKEGVTSFVQKRAPHFGEIQKDLLQ
jgi:enoyl-CoA hydratase/carnithine racemase